MRQSTAIRCREVCAITRENYEPERRDRCYMAIYRRIIRPRFGISYKTYLRYISTPPRYFSSTGATS